MHGRDPFDGEHVRRGPEVDIVALSHRRDFVEGLDEDALEAVVDRLEIPEVPAPVLYPLEVADRGTACIRQDVGNDVDALLIQDPVRVRRRGAVGALADDLRANVRSILGPPSDSRSRIGGSAPN